MTVQAGTSFFHKNGALASQRMNILICNESWHLLIESISFAEEDDRLRVQDFLKTK